MPYPLAALSLVCTALGALGIGWSFPPAQALSLVRWPGLGHADYHPLAASVTVMTGQANPSGAAFQARHLTWEDWRQLPHPNRIPMWLTLAEAPLRGAGTIEWLWDSQGKPASALFTIAAPATPFSAAILIEDTSSGQRWLFERQPETP